MPRSPLIARACGVMALLAPVFTYGLTLTEPPADLAVVGQLRTIIAASGANLPDVAVKYRIGRDALQRANPHLPQALPVGHRPVRLPTRFVLPRAPREDIVVNLPERRLYLYVPAWAAQPARVMTYAVSIGRVDWQTPLGESRIVARRKAPVWTPPESIREEARERGVTLPAVVPAGPENPLGQYALYLDRAGYLIHGTNDSRAIGLRVTHGCVRLYPQDIAELYRRVALGTSVRFVNEPVKVGWYAGQLYIEVHPPLKELEKSRETLLDSALRLVGKALRNRASHVVVSSRIRHAVERRDGIPVVISRDGRAGNP